MNTNREKRKEIAQQTLEILNKGYYHIEGNVINIKDDLNNAVENSKLYTPEAGENILSDLKYILKDKKTQDTEIEVMNRTTLYALQKLQYEKYFNPACLNFASPTNPGGGFKKGSQAQEESLARASGLYSCLSIMKEMYNYNRKNKTALYSDYMIYSPSVPVFRDENDNLLREPYNVSFITAPAVNAKLIHEKEPQNADKITPTMIKRIEKILSLALINGHTAIVLGAYGCGVFGNNPKDVASYFKRLLLEDYRFKNKFKKVIFAVLDNTKNQKIIKNFSF